TDGARQHVGSGCDPKGSSSVHPNAGSGRDQIACEFLGPATVKARQTVWCGCQPPAVAVPGEAAASTPRQSPAVTVPGEMRLAQDTDTAQPKADPQPTVRRGEERRDIVGR